MASRFALFHSIRLGPSCAASSATCRLGRAANLSFASMIISHCLEILALSITLKPFCLIAHDDFKAVASFGYLKTNWIVASWNLFVHSLVAWLLNLSLEHFTTVRSVWLYTSSLYFVLLRSSALCLHLFGQFYRYASWMLHTNDAARIYRIMFTSICLTIFLLVYTLLILL